MQSHPVTELINRGIISNRFINIILWDILKKNDYYFIILKAAEPEYRGLAKKYFTSYLRSLQLFPGFAKLNVKDIDCNAFASSLGLGNFINILIVIFTIIIILYCYYC